MTIIQQGGIKIIESFGDFDRDNVFDYFINNSLLEIIPTNSKGGILFKLNLKIDIPSPYVLNRSNYPETPVRSLLFKLVLIRDRGDHHTIFYKNWKTVSQQNYR